MANEISGTLGTQKEKNQLAVAQQHTAAPEQKAVAQQKNL
jgi:hypothetical protein